MNDTIPHWLPEPGDDTRPFFDGAREGRLCLQACDDCGAFAYPPTTCCQECGSSAIGWRDAAGDGVVYAHARLARVYHPRHEGRLPIILAQVDIPEGLRLMTNIIDADPGAVKAGDAVTVAFETFPDGSVVPVFRPKPA